MMTKCAWRKLYILCCILFSANSWAGEPAKDIHNPTRRVLFLDFINHLVTLSYYLYKEKLQNSFKESTSSLMSKCLLHLISANIRPNACKVRGYVFSDPKRSSHALTHMEKAFHIYQSLCKPQNRSSNQPVIKMRQFLHVLKDFRLINDDLSATAVVNILASDDPAVSDGDCINLEREMTFLEFFEALVGCAEVFVTDSMIKDPNTPREPGMEETELDDGVDACADFHHRESLAVSSVPASSTTPVEDATTVTESPAPQTGGGASETRKSLANESVVGAETGRSGGKRGHHRASGRASSKAAPVPEPLPEEVPPVREDASVPELHPTTEPASDEVDITEGEVESNLVGQTGEHVEDGLLEELDVETRAFNFWTHQLHIFFMRKLFPAAERFNIIQTRLTARLQSEMVEQMKLAIIEVNRQIAVDDAHQIPEPQVVSPLDA